MARSMAVSALGIRAVTKSVAALMTPKALYFRAVFPYVSLLHHPTVGTRFGVRVNNHYDER